MLGAQITQGKFGQYQKIFYDNVRVSPTCADLEIIAPQITDNTYESFVGDSPRISTFKDIKCLYDRTLTNFQRQKFGLAHDVSGTIYVSPVSLKQALGYWKLDPTKLKVVLLDEHYIVNRIKWLGYFKSLDTCVCLEIRLINDTKGGK